MPVQTSPQPLLVKEMGNQTDTPAEHEQTVEHTHLQVVLGLLGAEGTAVAHQINEADSHASVHIQDEVVLLGRCHRLNRKRIVQHLAAGEVLLDELLYELHTEIGVVA